MLCIREGSLMVTLNVINDCSVNGNNPRVILSLGCSELGVSGYPLGYPQMDNDKTPGDI
jgi:hypothetical protein